MSHSIHGMQGTVSGLGFPFLPIDQHLLFIDILEFRSQGTALPLSAV